MYLRCQKRDKSWIIALKINQTVTKAKRNKKSSCLSLNFITQQYIVSCLSVLCRIYSVKKCIVLFSTCFFCFNHPFLAFLSFVKEKRKKERKKESSDLRPQSDFLKNVQWVRVNETALCLKNVREDSKSEQQKKPSIMIQWNLEN